MSALKKFFLFLFIISASEIYCKEWIPEYSVTRDILDPALKKTEALFVFNFFDSNGKKIEKEIKIGYNGKNESLKPVQKSFSLKLVPGKYYFQFYFNDKHYEVKTDSVAIKPGYRIEMRVEFRSSEMPVLIEKPVIYLYPKNTTVVSVKLDVKGELEFTYPQYKDGWNFTADPDGIIKMGNKKYHYLFWDGKVKIDRSKINLNEGFIVEKEKLVNFFEEKLALMGLNPKEIGDYITYWGPRMVKNENNFVRFVFNEEYAEYASLQIDPKPDNLFRVFMLWCPCDKSEKVSEQKIASVKRDGFTVIEWGGSEIPYYKNCKQLNP